MKRILIALTLALGACDKAQPPAPTAQQADQLNEAEAMLNAMAGNEEGPEANASSPSNSSE